jgi:hypothetical protein
MTMNMLFLFNRLLSDAAYSGAFSDGGEHLSVDVCTKVSQ